MSPIRATILIAALSLLSKFLGAFRQAVFAHSFGAGAQVDIYVAAFRVPDLLFNLLILGTLSVAFIPVFLGYVNKDRQEALRIGSTIFNITLAAMAALSFLGVLMSEYLVELIVPGFSPAAKAQTAHLTRIMMLSPLLFSLSSVLTSVLQSHKKFFAAAVAPLFYNLSIIFGVIYLYPRLGLGGLAAGVVSGAFLHFVVQLPQSLRLGLRPLRFWDWRHPGVKKIWKLFFPRIFGIELGQISLLAASVLGSFMSAGSLAVFYFAYDLETVPLGIFAISFAIAAFPTMAELFGKQDTAGLRSFIAKTAIQVLFLMIPVSVLMLLLRAQLVRLILGAGRHTNFSFADTRHTAQALGFFALSLFAQSLVPLLARGFYAMHNTIIPVLSGLAASAVNIFLAYVFTRFGGPETMALAFSIAIILHMLLMLWLLHKRLNGLEDEFLILRTTKIGIASIAMGITTFITLYVVAPMVDMQTYVGVATQTGFALLVAMLTYLTAGLLIKLPEASDLIQVLRNWFAKFSKPLTTAVIDMFTDFR